MQIKILFMQMKIFFIQKTFSIQIKIFLYIYKKYFYLHTPTRQAPSGVAQCQPHSAGAEWGSTVSIPLGRRRVGQHSVNLTWQVPSGVDKKISIIFYLDKNIFIQIKVFFIQPKIFCLDNNTFYLDKNISSSIYFFYIKIFFIQIKNSSR